MLEKSLTKKSFYHQLLSGAIFSIQTSLNLAHFEFAKYIHVVSQKYTVYILWQFNKAEILLPSGGARGFEPNNLKPSSSVKLRMLNSKLSLINRVMMTRMTDDLGDDRVDAEDDSNEF